MIVAWLAVSCVYVGQQAFEDRLAQLDNDGDGVPGAADCNDRNAAQAPGLPEIPYDGLDNDCLGDGDLIDADFDGFPGVLAEDYVGEEYPPEYEGRPLDCADDPAEFPNAADVNPAQTVPDVPYDGVDGSCDGSNDYDADGDGYLPRYVLLDGVRIDVQEAFERYLVRFGIDRATADGFVATGDSLASASFADCDDNDASLRPGNGVEDVFYDGIDSNCDEQNDFDADGDGFMPPEAEDLWQAYLDRHWAGGPPDFRVPTERPFGDCLDQPNANFPSLIPDQIRPSEPGNLVPDEFFDGIDSDCARNNDFDEDGDGFMAAGTSEFDYEAYITGWGITEAERQAWGDANPDARLVDPPGRGDCDDRNSQVWPGAIETLGGNADRDCDGVVGVGGLVFGATAPDAPDAGYRFSGATNPEIARMGDDFVVFVAANSAELVAETELTATGVAIPIPMAATAQRGQVPTSPLYPVWKATPQAVQDHLDLAVDPAPFDADFDGMDDPRVTVLTTQTDPVGSDQTWLFVADVWRSTSTSGFTGDPADLSAQSPSYVPEDVEVGYDQSGDVFAIGCRATSPLLHGFRRIGPGETGREDERGASVCYLDAPPAADGDVPVTACSAPTCTPWLLDDEATWQADGDPTTADRSFADTDEGLVMTVTDGEATVRGFSMAARSVLEDLGPVVRFDAYDDGNALVVAGIVQSDGRRLWVERHVGTTVERGEIRIDVPELAGRTLDGVAVYGDSDRVAVAIRASGGANDTIGWVFMNP